MLVAELAESQGSKKLLLLSRSDGEGATSLTPESPQKPFRTIA